MSTKSSEDQPTFNLGLTMAGAVSAGCYTGGVLDYLYEILDLWQKAKDGELEIDGSPVADNLIPKHNVVIDAIGGTSAGGMASVMSILYPLTQEIRSVKDIPKNPLDDYNTLWNAWVHLNDKENQDKLTFSQVWSRSDLNAKPEEGKKLHDNLKSLFNTEPIEKISDKAFSTTDGKDLKEQISKLPPWISKDLELFLSHTMLRGIPLEVDFTTDKSGATKHTSYEHYMASQYRLNYGEKPEADRYLWLNPFEETGKRRMQLSTIATGAFPIGLKYREFHTEDFSEAYVKTIITRILTGDFGKKVPDFDGTIKFENFPKDYLSVTIDGGAINNEPYREVASIVDDRKTKNEDSKGHYDFGLIMIDPFPDVVTKDDEYDHPDNLLDVIPGIIGTLWDQSKVKRREALEQYKEPAEEDPDYYKYLRGQIYPVKKKTKNGDFPTEKNMLSEGGQGDTYVKYPIASGSFGAFGGFLDINFRVHDFFLGRDNARNFLRFHYTLPYYENDPAKNHPIHKDWTPEMVKQFKVEKKGVTHLPVVPDFNLLIKGTTSIDCKEHRYYTIPENPEYDPNRLWPLQKAMTARYKTIFKHAAAALGDSDPKKDAKKKKGQKDARPWINKFYGKGWFGRAFSKLGGWVLVPFKGIAINKAQGCYESNNFLYYQGFGKNGISEENELNQFT